jgi:hypothetical protein
MYSWVEGHATEVLEPGDTHTFEAAIERAGEEVPGLVDGERRVGVDACNGTE